MPDFILVIQVKSKALEFPRNEHHALSYEPKAICLKNWWNISTMGNAFNSPFHHHFNNYLMCFLFLFMAEFGNEMPTITSKDFPKDKTPDKLSEQLFRAS